MRNEREAEAFRLDCALPPEVRRKNEAKSCIDSGTSRAGIAATSSKTACRTRSCARRREKCRWNEQEDRNRGLDRGAAAALQASAVFTGARVGRAAMALQLFAKHRAHAEKPRSGRIGGESGGLREVGNALAAFVDSLEYLGVGGAQPSRSCPDAVAAKRGARLWDVARLGKVFSDSRVACAGSVRVGRLAVDDSSDPRIGPRRVPRRSQAGERGERGLAPRLQRRQRCRLALAPGSRARCVHGARFERGDELRQLRDACHICITVQQVMK